MSNHQHWGGKIRKLWPSEATKFREHLLRLDPASRRTRFTHAVSDSFITDYATHMADSGSIVYAFLDDNGLVRAAAELKKLGSTWGRDAEAAFSVEADYQDHGLGSDLMGKVIRSARNRGVEHLYISCLASNTKMQAIARKHDAMLRFESGEVVGEILPEGPDYFSVLAEAAEDRADYVMAVLDLRNRLLSAA